MPLRTHILRLLLGSLAVAAVAGVFAVLFADGEIIGRIALTAFVTAITAGVLLRAASGLDQRASRPSAIVAFASSMVAYVLLLLLIWVTSSFGGRFMEHVAATVFLVLLAGLQATIAVRLISAPTARLGGIVATVATVVGSLLALIAIWAVDSRREGEFYMSAWLVGLGGAATGLCLLDLGRRRHRLWRIPAAAGCALAVVVLLWLVFTDRDDEEIVVPAMVFPVVFALAGVLFALPVRRAHAMWVRAGTIGAALAGALCLTLAAWVPSTIDELFGRAAGAAGIVTGCGSLATLVFLFLQRGPQLEAASTSFAIALTCPRCRLSLTLPPGRSACSGCGLRFDLRVEEPSCATCGYLLYRTESPHCPECGTPVGPHAAETAA